MKMLHTITPMTVGLNTVLRVPASWDRFVYRGFATGL